MSLERINGPEVVVTDLNRAGLIHKWRMSYVLHNTKEYYGSYIFRGKRDYLSKQDINSILGRLSTNKVVARNAWECICELADEFDFLDKDWFEQSALEQWTFGKKTVENIEIIQLIFDTIGIEAPFDSAKIHIPTPDQIMSYDLIENYPFWNNEHLLYYPETEELIRRDIDISGLANRFMGVLRFVGIENDQYKNNLLRLETIRNVLLRAPVKLNAFRKYRYHHRVTITTNCDDYFEHKKLYFIYENLKNSFLEMCMDPKSVNKKILNSLLQDLDLIDSFNESNVLWINELLFLERLFEKHFGVLKGGISMISDGTRDGALNIINPNGGITEVKNREN